MTQQEQIQAKVKELKTNIALGEDLRKLLNNRLFKKVIEDHFFSEYVSNLVPLLNSNAPDHVKESVERQLVSVGGLKNYISAVLAEAEQSKDQLAQIESGELDLDEEEL